MKIEFDMEKPLSAKENWPGQYDLFSWVEYATNIPFPIFIITTLKENRKPNANLWSWCFFTGEGKGFYWIISLLNSTHTYKNIGKDKEWCINVPSLDQWDQCRRSIENNDLEIDEIHNSGFTVEPSVRIESPRIKECMISFECKQEWKKQLFPGSRYTIFAGRVVHVAIDSHAIQLNQKERLEQMKIMYSLRAQLDPRTGKTSPGGITVLATDMFKET
ncbi:MAG: flavin reductase [Spirochaetales bacterium]|nr:flavin reductase [Spirochaetales bacterium]